MVQRNNLGLIYNRCICNNWKMKKKYSVWNPWKQRGEIGNQSSTLGSNTSASSFTNNSILWFVNFETTLCIPSNSNTTHSWVHSGDGWYRNILIGAAVAKAFGSNYRRWFILETTLSIAIWLSAGGFLRMGTAGQTTNMGWRITTRWHTFCIRSLIFWSPSSEPLHELLKVREAVQRQACQLIRAKREGWTA